MASNTNNVIISYFAGQDLAATAGDEIRDWDKANDDIKLGGIGILTWKDGEIKTNKLVRASGGTGAKWGMALGVTAGILSGGATLVAGAVAGATVGAVSAKLFHKNIGLTDDDKARLEQRLSTGSAALVVMAADDEGEPTKAELNALGGEVEAYRVPADTMVQVEAAQEVRPDRENRPLSSRPHLPLRLHRVLRRPQWVPPLRLMVGRQPGPRPPRQRSPFWSAPWSRLRASAQRMSRS